MSYFLVAALGFTNIHALDSFFATKTIWDNRGKMSLLPGCEKCTETLEEFSYRLKFNETKAAFYLAFHRHGSRVGGADEYDELETILSQYGLQRFKEAIEGRYKLPRKVPVLKYVDEDLSTDKKGIKNLMKEYPEKYGVFYDENEEKLNWRGFEELFNHGKTAKTVLGNVGWEKDDFKHLKTFTSHVNRARASGSAWLFGFYDNDKEKPVKTDGSDMRTRFGSSLFIQKLAQKANALKTLGELKSEERDATLLKYMEVSGNACPKYARSISGEHCDLNNPGECCTDEGGDCGRTADEWTQQTGQSTKDEDVRNLDASEVQFVSLDDLKQNARKSLNPEENENWAQRWDTFGHTLVCADEIARPDHYNAEGVEDAVEAVEDKMKELLRSSPKVQAWIQDISSRMGINLEQIKTEVKKKQEEEEKAKAKNGKRRLKKKNTKSKKSKKSKKNNDSSDSDSSESEESDSDSSDSDSKKDSLSDEVTKKVLDILGAFKSYAGYQHVQFGESPLLDQLKWKKKDLAFLNQFKDLKDYVDKGYGIQGSRGLFQIRTLLDYMSEQIKTVSAQLVFSHSGSLAKLFSFLAPLTMLGTEIGEDKGLAKLFKYIEDGEDEKFQKEVDEFRETGEKFFEQSIFNALASKIEILVYYKDKNDDNTSLGQESKNDCSRTDRCMFVIASQGVVISEELDFKLLEKQFDRLKDCTVLNDCSELYPSS